MAELASAPDVKCVGGLEFELPCIMSGLNDSFGSHFGAWNIRAFSYTSVRHHRNPKFDWDVIITPVGWHDGEFITLLMRNTNAATNEWCALRGGVHSKRFFPHSTHDFFFTVDMDYKIEASGTESKNLLKSLGLS
jgi:hypothetical protein